MKPSPRGMALPPASEHAPAHRVLALCAGVCAGILIARAVGPIATGALLAGGASSAVLALLVPGRCRLAALVCASVLLAWGYYDVRMGPPGPRSIARLLGDTPTLIEVEGEVVTVPRLRRTNEGVFGDFAFRENVTRFVLRVDRVVGAPHSDGVTGSLYARISGHDDSIRVGQRIALKGYASVIGAPSNPGEPAFAEVARERGIVGRITSPGGSLVRILKEPGVLSLGAKLRSWIERRTAGAFDAGADEDAGSALLAALTLGQRDEIMRELSPAFGRAGVAHVLALSGLHLGILVGAGVLLVRLTGDRPVLESALGIAMAAGYWALVPTSGPITRATIMAIALLGGQVFGRRYHAITMLGWAMLAVLAWRPSQLVSPGFQLSFGIVAALIVLTDRVRDILFGERILIPEPSLRTSFSAWSQRLIAGYLCAWCVSIPVVMYHFGYVSIVGAVSSFFVVPLAGVLLIGGFTTLCVAIVSPWAASLLARAFTPLGDAIVAFVAWCDALPFASVTTPVVSAAWAVCATAVLVVWMRSGRRWEWRCAAAGGLCVAWLGVASIRTPIDGDVHLRADMLSVGDGTCIVLRSGRDVLMYDCGSTWVSVGARTIPDACRALGVHRVPDVVVSHANLDHYSGLVDAAQPLGVQRTLCPRALLDEAHSDPTGPVAMLIDRLSALGVEHSVLARGDALALGHCSVRVLSPPDEPWANGNDGSLVLLVEVPAAGGEPKHFLLCGDIERRAMEFIADQEPDLRVVAMEAPHHGSARPQAYAFVDWLDPRVVLQSTGPRRAGDERWDDVKLGRTWHTTTTDGACWVEFLDDGTVRSGSLRRSTQGPDGPDG